jgi:hypothetical protein
MLRLTLNGLDRARQPQDRERFFLDFLPVERQRVGQAGLAAYHGGKTVSGECAFQRLLRKPNYNFRGVTIGALDLRCRRNALYLCTAQSRLPNS